jgi:hypothetical protein
MKLGIAVVYTGGPGHADLIDLHLRQIGKTTGVPYTVFGCAKRLAPENRRLIGRHPNVVLSDSPPTRLRGSLEHSGALEPLIRRAVEHGSTHVCVLHMDSFPVRPEWARRMAGLLEKGTAFVTVERVGTVCLFFPRGFFLSHKPALLVPENERKDPVFIRFVREVRPIDHSGIGYAYRAYAAGLRWHALQTAWPGSFSGELHGDSIVHLGGAVRIGYDRGGGPGGTLYVRALGAISRRMRMLAGKRQWREWVGKIQWTRLAALKEILVEKPRITRARENLLGDVEAFLKEFKNGA